jgi:hypothetical protein
MGWRGARRARHRFAVVAVVLVAAFLGPVIGGPGTASASTSAQDVTFVGGDRDASGDPEAFVGTALPGGFKFFDGDLPGGLSAIAVRLRSTADPTGIVLLARRTARNDAYYRAWFTFSTVASDQQAATIEVADGATLTATYLDATNAQGLPETVERTATWHRGSAMPDPRELVFSTADPTAPIVHGAWRAVGPGATVDAYAHVAGGTPIGTATADATGAFELATTAQSPVLDGVYVTATEPGEAASARRYVPRAAVTGRVVLPEPERQPVLSAFAWVRPPGTPDPCDPYPPPANCVHGGAISDHGGRWAWPRGAGGGDFPPGPYDVDITNQGFSSEAIDEPWKSGAYGNPPTYRVDVTDVDVTAEAGEVALTPPNVMGRAVDSAGFGIEDVVIFVLSPQGDHLPGGGNTRADGRFALRLPDGDYRLRLLPPNGCAGYHQVDTGVIHVAGGVADPPSGTYDMGAGSLASPDPVSVPVNGAAPVQLELGVPGSPVGVTLDGAQGSGSVVAGCGAVAPPPGIVAVRPPVDVHAPGLSFDSASVCLAYGPDDLARAGAAAGEVELFHVLASGAVERITGTRDAATGVVCGTTASFSSFVLGVARSTSAPPPSLPRTPTSTTPATPPSAAHGYWMVTTAGEVYAFGGATWFGNAPLTNTAAVDVETTPTTNGYWIVDDAGHVFAFGDAPYLGGTTPAHGERVTSLSRTPTGNGYWLFTSTGRAVPFGDATWFGDMRGTRLNGPVLDSVATPSGAGYYMVASDGGVFTFGDASFHGSMGSTHLNAPVLSLVPDTDGVGYWLVAGDGGIFTFDAPFRGSMGGTRLNRPVTGMVGAAGGYLMVGEDGGIFTFGDAPFSGSLGDHPPAHAVTSVAAI